MKKIEFKYKRLIQLVRTVEVDVPENWGELNESQFKAVTEQMFGKLKPEEFFCRFFSIDKPILNRLDGLQIFKLSELIQFISDTTLPCNIWILKKIGPFNAPSPNLGKVSLQQWMTADTYFNRYISSDKEELLNYAIAAIYLRKGISFFGKKKVNLSKEAIFVSKHDLMIRKAVFLNFVLIKNWLSSSYPFLFPLSEKKESSSKGTDWLEIFDKLVGENLTQIDGYKKMAVTDAFRIMNRRIKEAKK